MAAKTGLTIVKKFSYRGDANEEWSNTYHFTGTVPADSTAWRALFDAVVLQEKTVYTADVHVIRGYGYADDADNATSVWTVDLEVSPETPVAGTLSIGTQSYNPGDCAVWARWKTSRLNTKGKAIYLRKYFHLALSASTSDFDTIGAAQKAALIAFAGKMDDGTLVGSRKITARTHDDVILNHGASSYITTRSLKRRGKRPGS